MRFWVLLDMRVLRIATVTTSLLLAMVCSAPVRADDLSLARELLTEAAGLLDRQSLSPERAADLWTNIASAQAKVGQVEAATASFARAWKAAGAIHDDYHRGLALNNTADQQTSAGQLRQAIAQTRASVPAGEQWRVLLWIAAALEKNKDLAGARQTIDAIPAADPESQARQLSFLAEIDAAQHNFPAALSACDQIHADLAHAQRLIEKAGSIETLSPADRVIVSCAGSKRLATMMIVIALNRAGQFNAAIEVARRLNHDPGGERATEWIAEAAADAGQLDLAQKCRNELSDQRRKDDAAVRIVAALAKTGRFKEASNLADEIHETHGKGSRDL